MKSLCLQYIFHDGFLLKTERANIIFDYWKDPDSATPRFLEELDKTKPLYVFVSHHHKDHYNPEIFQWAGRFRDIRYVLSRDTFRAARHFFTGTHYKGPRRILPQQVIALAPGENYHDGSIFIEAFGSTDIGNSYLVSIEGKKIFHAGDLNAWVWKEESTQEEITEAVAQFEKILENIRTKTESFDLAMFPVDPRLGRDFWTGAYIFVRWFRVKVFVPMHFTLANHSARQLEFIAAATNFSAYSNPGYGDYVALSTPGSEICIN